MSGKLDQPAGSPTAGEPVFLAIGFVRRSHGLEGAVFVEVFTDFPDRHVAGTQVYAGEQHEPLTIRQCRKHQDGLLILFKGIQTPEQAACLRGKYLYVSAHDRPPLPPGEYYHHQLIGLKVLDENGNPLGSLASILQTGANDVYVVIRPDGSELLIPAVAHFVKKIDLTAGLVYVHLLPGMLGEKD